METSRVEKGDNSDEVEGQILEPLLVRLNDEGTAPHDIRIDKSEFKIGRARENDEIILDTMISRRHCVLRNEGNGDWVVKDLSSTSTLVNGTPLTPGDGRILTVGDVIQFSTSEEFKYAFTLVEKGSQGAKYNGSKKKLLNAVLTEQQIFSKSQERQKKEFQDKLDAKLKEQVALKQQLVDILEQRDTETDDNKDLRGQITTLENRIETGNAQKQHLQDVYNKFLEKLESERVLFESKLNDEKQKWQKALDMSKQETETVEVRMKEQMARWREEQQAEWRNLMEDRVREEKNIQAQLLDEKMTLEKKLEETKEALKKQEAMPKTLETRKNKDVTFRENSIDSCIFVNVSKTVDSTRLEILDTIDLTGPSQANVDSVKDCSVIGKVYDIMEEQLTCSICSELFVKATTLNCMHTFCEYCIILWNNTSKICPVCRAPVVCMNRSLVLDNFIGSMMDSLPLYVMYRRKQLLQERQELEKKRKRKRKR
ncbi:hypothetical protein KM043_002971 [Ampulex compressa]|nr:hypothetical protein KM043_002971 [Ampulex compressa]